MPDRHPGPLGDEVGVDVRVVPEIAPVRLEFFVARDRHSGEARRSGLVLVKTPVELSDQLEIVRRPWADPDAGLDGLHRRCLAHGPDELDAEGKPQPGVDQSLVARGDQGEMAGGAGRCPACRKRAVQVANRLALALRRRAAGEVDHRAPVPEHRVVLNPADHVGHQVVPAERNDAARQLVI